MGGGVYFISASMLQTVLIKPWGPWRADYEAGYQYMEESVPKAWDDPSAAAKLAEEFKEPNFAKLLALYDSVRFARLAAYLRQRRPTDYIGYSILVYRLTDAEVQTALFGPPPEIKPKPDLNSRW